MKNLWILAVIALAAVLLASAVYFLYLRPGASGRDLRVVEWIFHPDKHPDWAVHAGERCANAPFLLPTSGYIGYLWDDSFRPGHRHSGIDMFGGTDPGITPVVAVHDGYLTRRMDWKSSVILRIPQDPLRPGLPVWVYYTHMADSKGKSFISSSFPPGTTDMFVSAGTLLGYQGNYSGSPDSPVGVHLHFSIVLDDGKGTFTNELDIRNTLDPSPYLGLPLNAKTNQDVLPVCKGDS